jgi:hypothetical protein
LGGVLVVGPVLDFDVENFNPKNKVKSSGQECPLHTKNYCPVPVKVCAPGFASKGKFSGNSISARNQFWLAPA